MGKWITLLADLHGDLPTVRPDSYLVLIGGDICPDLSLDGQASFLNGPFRKWLLTLPCPCLAVAGNHDLYLNAGNRPELPWTFIEDGQTFHVNGLMIWGCSVVLKPSAWEEDEVRMEKACQSLARSTDIVLTHNPPLGILDKPHDHAHLGSLPLRHAIWKMKPRLHVFGHSHPSRGWTERSGTYFVNTARAPWGLADNSWRNM